MEELLCDAAMRGDLALLYDIIARDVYILDRVSVGSLKGKNPLHVAISTGKTHFVLQLLKTKPDLAGVLAMELGAALHVASAKGHIKIVKALVKISPEMCLARDRDGNNLFTSLQSKVRYKSYKSWFKPALTELKLRWIKTTPSCTYV